MYFLFEAEDIPAIVMFPSKIEWDLTSTDPVSFQRLAHLGGLEWDLPSVSIRGREMDGVLQTYILYT